MEPQVISALIKSNVEKYRNDRLYEEITKQEEKEKDVLSDMANHWDMLYGHWPAVKDFLNS